MAGRIGAEACVLPGLGAFLLICGSEFQATAHDGAHDAFMTLPPYTRISEDEARQLGSGPKPCWVGKCREEMLSSEGLSEALVQEVASLGIHVTIVEPGEFRTDFAGRSLVRAHREIAGYAQTSGATRKQLAQVNGHQAGDPRRAAQAMIQFVETAGPPLRLVLGGDALARMRGKLASVAQELEKWQDTTLATAFEETSAR